MYKSITSSYGESPKTKCHENNGIIVITTRGYIGLIVFLILITPIYLLLLPMLSQSFTLLITLIIFLISTSFRRKIVLDKFKSTITVVYQLFWIPISKKYTFNDIKELRLVYFKEKTIRWSRGPELEKAAISIIFYPDIILRVDRSSDIKYIEFIFASITNISNLPAEKCCKFQEKR